MKKIFIIIKREYLQILRAKVFLISTLLGPLLVLGLLALPAALAMFQPGGARRLAVIDETGRLFDPLSRALAGDTDDASAPPRITSTDSTEDSLRVPGVRYEVERIAVSGENLGDTLRLLSERVRRKELDAYLVLPRDVMTGGEAIYYARNVSDLSAIRRLESVINRVVVEGRFADAGTDPESARRMLGEVGFATIEVGESGESRGGGGRFLVALGVGAFVLLTILMYGQVILSAVVEEKTSRLFEVLNSSASASQLLIGKLIGVSLAALTQFAVWALALLLLLAVGSRVSAAENYGALVTGFSPSFPAYALLFFLTGFFLCTIVYAALGAAVSSEKEASQVATYISLLFSIGIYLALPVVRSPDSAYSFWVSIIPFVSPVTMLARIAIEPPPFWQIALALALNAAAAAALLIFATRIYGAGMLSTGKRVHMRDMLGWARR